MLIFTCFYCKHSIFAISTEDIHIDGKGYIICDKCKETKDN